MADTINIAVTTELEPLQQLIDKLNAGSISVGEYRKAISQLSSITKVGSQDQIDLKNVQAQVAEQTRVTTGRVNEQTQVLRDARQEHRAGMFVMMELIRTMDAFGLKNEDVKKTLAGGMETYFGVSFALNAMGGEMAKIATPVGIAVGIFMALKSTVDELNSAFEQAADRLEKVDKATGRLTAAEQIAGINKQIADLKASAASAGAPSAWQWVQALLGGIVTGDLTGGFREASTTNVLNYLAQAAELEKQRDDAVLKNIEDEKKKVKIGEETLQQLLTTIQGGERLATTEDQRVRLKLEEKEVQKEISDQAKKRQTTRRKRTRRLSRRNKNSWRLSIRSAISREIS